MSDALEPYLAAVVQLTSTREIDRSFGDAERLVRHARTLGATFVVLPECVSFMGSEEEKAKLAEPIDGPSFGRLAHMARENRIWLVGGTLPERSPEGQKAFNTSTLWNPEGDLVAKYQKIHLFDVALGEGATHLESEWVEPGTSATLAKTVLGQIGMSICYDLRFPDIYRTLIRGGAEILPIPSAFTVPTGRDHWEILVRARAIEGQAYVLAAGQVGANTKKRRTYGRSMIVDPWGTVLAACVDKPSVAVAEIDLGRVAELRRKLPCLAHESDSARTLSSGR